MIGSFVNRRIVLSCWIILGLILIPTAISQSFASQMEVFLSPERDASDPVFTSIRFVTLSYEPGSDLAKIFNGTNERITFTLNYTAQVRGDENRAQISYKIKFVPHITNFVLPSNSTTPALDLDWRSVIVQGPLTVTVPKYGKFDINYPIGPIKALFPAAAQKLMSVEESKNIFETPLLDYEEIGFPMDRWHFLFDPTGSQASAAGSGYLEEGGSKVVSVFSLGESSFREGTHAAKESSASVPIDDSEVNI